MERTPGSRTHATYTLGIDTDKFAETPTSNNSDGQQPKNVLSFQQKYLKQPQTEPKKINIPTKW
jgi:hypothetical protein